MEAATPSKHISEIRLSKFGIDAEGNKHPSPLERDLRQALGHLAVELYSKKHHFILELIQNAEDNAYAPDISPSLTLQVFPNDPTETPGAAGCLLLLNNEIGFQPEQVLSLCSVGQSTKNKRDGYIGEKGIGFKSVFQASPRPHMFSNGYQFFFSRPIDDEDLGYIVPHWIEKTPDIVRASAAQTAILLPLTAGEYPNIAKHLEVISPESILFLNKLRELHIQTESVGRKAIRSGRIGFVQLVCDGKESKYFVTRAKCPRPSLLQEEKRIGIDERELTVALPLSEAGQCKGRVFAFLPTECHSGLPFLINADFLLTASRESLLVDRLWNVWLRDCIAPTFVAGFKALLTHPEWCKQAYRFIPIQDDLNAQMADFFQPTVARIHEKLRGEECILTVKGTLVTPGKAWLASKTERRLLAQPDAPPQLEQYLFIDPELERFRSRLKTIGVHDFTTTDLLKVIDDRTWLEQRDDSWWESAFTLFAERQVKAADVKHISLIRCSDGVCRQANPAELYFLSGSGANLPNLPLNGPSVHLFSAALQERLKSTPVAWNWLTQVLGLREFSIRSYIMDRLLPWMVSESGEDAVANLITSTRYIASNLSCLNDSDRATLRERLPWIIGSNIVAAEHRNGRELVMPEALQDQDGWNWVFVGPADREHFLHVSDQYVHNASPETRTAMIALFKAVGVTSVPDPARCEPAQGGDRYNQALARCEAEVSGAPPLREYLSPRWLREMTSVAETQNGNLKIAALERLLQSLYQHSHERTTGFLKLARSGLQGWRSLNADSELGSALKTKPWLNTTQGYQRPADTFVDVPEIREFLGDSVPYVNTTLAPAFLERLGVRVRLTPNVLLNLLRQMRDNESADISLIVRIYRRLHDLKFDLESFRTEKLIYSKKPRETWRRLGESVWEDAGSVFDDHFGYLSLTYSDHDLHNFFTARLGVPGQPEASQFAEVWANLSTSPNPDRQLTEKRLRRIIERLIAERDKFSGQEWWIKIQPKLKIWTIAGSFITPADAYVPDDGHAAELFAKHVPIAWLPGQAHSSIPFLQALGCRSLANALQVDISNGTHSTVTPAMTVLTPESKELIVLMFCNGAKWRERVCNLEILLKTEEHLATNVTAEYSLTDITVPAVSEARDAFWCPRKVSLIKKQGADPDAWRSSAAESIAASFAGAAQRREMADKLYRLLTASPATARRIQRERNWIFTVDQQSWLEKCQWQFVISSRQAVDNEPTRLGQQPKQPAKSLASETSKPTGTTVPTGSQPTNKLSAPQSVPKAAPAADSPPAQTSPAASPPPTTTTSAAPATTTSTAPATTTSTAPATNSATTRQNSNASSHGNQSTSTAKTAVAVKKPGSRRPKMLKGETRQRRLRKESGPVEKPDQRDTVSRDSKSGLESVSHADKKEIERQGRAHAIIELKHLGYKVTEMSDQNPGYDLVAEKPGELIWIELKTHRRSSTKVFVTKREWKEYNRALRSNHAKWELWNVEYLADDEPRDVQITRYTSIPLNAVEQSGIWVDLNLCSFS